jgi:hypothetical protein
MVMRQPRYTPEEHARRGTEIYEKVVRPKVEADNIGRIVSIDVDTGEYELGDTTLEAAERLLGRLPNAEIWSERIGYPAVHRFGPRNLADQR